MYERTQLPGSGRINIGVTSQQTQTGRTHSMQISIGHSRRCSRPKRREVLQKARKEAKIESRLVPTWTAVTTTSIASALLAGSPAGSIVSTFAHTFNQHRYY